MSEHTKAPLSVLAADDHQIFLQGLCSLFMQIENYQLICTCTNGDDLLGLAKSEAPLLFYSISPCQGPVPPRC